jgi:ubiquinone/menaquinone biosynthesis C-methylase UbiE
MTRWQQFYLEDQRVLTAPPSDTVRYALDVFKQAGKTNLLDLGCGVGRDTTTLSESNPKIIGADAAHSGLMLAKERNPSLRLVEADARQLPFRDEYFDGIYCFGLLHEFVGERAKGDVLKVMQEIARTLQTGGLLVLATLAGELEQGLPHLQMFTEAMFDEIHPARLERIEKSLHDDIGCTGLRGYKVWRGVYRKIQSIKDVQPYVTE